MRVLFRILALSIGLLLAYGVTQLATSVLGIDLRKRLNRLELEFFPPPPTGLQVAHPTLGWTNNPGKAVRQTHEDYDVLYHIDEREGRVVPGRPEGAPIVEILGGSFTFGQGVEDHETFAAVLQQGWNQFRLRIRSSNGWGTAQAYVALSEDLARGDEIRLALYGWLPFHNGRNHLSEYWLSTVERAHQRLPHFSVRGGEPVFEGLVGSESAQPDGTPELAAAEWSVTEALVRAMDRMAREHGARFVFLFLPFENQKMDPGVARMVAFLEAEGIEYVQPEFSAEEYTRGLRFPIDGHPNATWHSLLAAQLAESVSPAERPTLAGDFSE